MDEKGMTHVFEDMKKMMTGAEAYRVAKFFLLECYFTSKNEYALWLATALESDPALMGDWADAIEEMLKERQLYGNKKLVNKAENYPAYKDCGCWEKQIEAHHKAINYTPPKES